MIIGPQKCFFEILQVALGNRKALSRAPIEEEWKAIFATSQKQAVAGFAFVALEYLTENGLKVPQCILLEWIGLSLQIKQRNLLINQRCKELEKLLADGGFGCCVLKGQGTAYYYQNPLCRQNGDIDVWVAKYGRYNKDEVRRDVLSFANNCGYHIGPVDVKHLDIDFFEDVPVEVHFMPSWMFNPLHNGTLQRFFKQHISAQFSNFDRLAGFTRTAVGFDVVFSLVHIYRHVFFEGVGMRQLLDYYHILIHSNQEQRIGAYEVLKELGMKSFAGGVMWVLKECLGLDEKFCLCDINERHGRFLLSEILIAGNFGQYDSRFKHQGKDRRLSNGFIQLRRNLRFLCFYPSEVLWSPIWKVWHWCWRKRKGYL